MANTFTPFVFPGPDPFRILYAESLVKPSSYTDPQTGLVSPPAYNAQFLIPKSHPLLPALNSALAQTAKAAFGTCEGVLFPLLDGDEENKRKVAAGGKAFDAYVGVYVLKVKSKLESAAGKSLIPPALAAYFPDQTPSMVDYVGPARGLAEQFFYSGVNALGKIAIGPTTIKDPRRGDAHYISAYVNGVMSLNTGERINLGHSAAATYVGMQDVKAHVGVISGQRVLPPAATGGVINVAGRPKEDWE